jgi:nitrogen fixation-related uncharacterized protein
MKMSYKPTPIFMIVLVLIGGAVAITLWFFWAIQQAQADDMPIRAVTAAQHAGCANMPRGSQEMENGRKQCFSELYGQGRYRLTRELVGRN